MPLTSSASLIVIDFSLSSSHCSAQTTHGCWCWKTIFKRTDAQNSNSSKEMHFSLLGFSIPQLFYVNIYPPHLKTNAQMPKMHSLSLPLSQGLSFSVKDMHCSDQKTIYHCFKYAWKAPKILNNLIFWRRKPCLSARESNKNKFKVIFINTGINCHINQTLFPFFLSPFTDGENLQKWYQWNSGWCTINCPGRKFLIQLHLNVVIKVQ